MRTDPIFRAALPTLFLVLMMTGLAAVFMPTESVRAAPTPSAGEAPADETPPEEEAEPETLPPLLSSLGLFTELPALKAADGTESYDVRYPAWIDGADVVRHHRLPAEPVIVGDDGRIEGHRHVGHRQFVADMIIGRDGYIYGVTWDAPVSIFRLRLSHEIKATSKASNVAATADDTAGPRREHSAASCRAAGE